MSRTTLGLSRQQEGEFLSGFAMKVASARSLWRNSARQACAELSAIGPY